MQAGYRVEQSTPKDIPDIIICDNFESLGIVKFYNWVGPIWECMLTDYTVAIFKIKPKTK